MRQLSQRASIIETVTKLEYYLKNVESHNKVRMKIWNFWHFELCLSKVALFKKAALNGRRSKIINSW